MTTIEQFKSRLLDIFHELQPAAERMDFCLDCNSVWYEVREHGMRGRTPYNGLVGIVTATAVAVEEAGLTPEAVEAQVQLQCSTQSTDGATKFRLRR